MEMRRFDVWVGRLAAAAGLVYVILCTLWPLNASADDSAVELHHSELIVPQDGRYRFVLPTVVGPRYNGTPTSASGNVRGGVDLAREAKGGTDQPALRHLRARHRIASLADQESLDGAGADAAAITALGLRYSLPTSYTSFIAVDRLVRNASVPSTTVDQPSPLPSGVSRFAVGADVPTTPEPPAYAPLIVALAVVATLVLYRRWLDPHASLDAYCATFIEGPIDA